jgi:hypothetical protein
VLTVGCLQPLRKDFVGWGHMRLRRGCRGYGEVGVEKLIAVNVGHGTIQLGNTIKGCIG